MPSYQIKQRRLVSQEDHALIARSDVPRSRFTGSWTRKTAFDAGKLVPFLVDEILPGDHMRYNVTAYLRMSTPLFPILDNQRVDTFFFFVPCRLLWENWTRFMGEQKTSLTDSPANYSIPQVTMPLGGFQVGSLWDHLGYPTQGQVTPGAGGEANVLPARAYVMIYNEWFRDQNLITPQLFSDGNGPDSPGNFPTFMYYRAKSHDYFTSCLPWPQKFTSPNVPITGLAPVTGIGATGTTAIASPAVVNETGGSATYANSFLAWSNNSPSSSLAIKATPGPTSIPQIYADLSQATGVSINQLRQAWLIQTLLEKDARGGTRYTEIVKTQFGVTSPDMRLQRPEYFGGGSSSMNITPIAQTAPTNIDGQSPVGALGAAGTAVGQHHGSFAATEHGYVIGLINVKSELSYQQGLHRMYSRKTRYDFYWPALAGLGEQAVYQKEIYYTGVPGPNDDDKVFGYNERWQEYRTRTSDVTGIMKSTAAGTLDNWHLGQRFATPPVLSSEFISDTPDMTRILAAGALAQGQHYLADILINREAVRPIPVYGTPVSIGNF